jgi:hypothetical protein
MWRAARDAATVLIRERILPPTLFPAGRGMAGRDFRSAKSQLSQVLFTVLLKLPQGGLGTVPPPPDDVDAHSGRPRQEIAGHTGAPDRLGMDIHVAQW